MRTVLYSPRHSAIYLWPPSCVGLVAYKPSTLPPSLRKFLSTIEAPASEYVASRNLRAPSPPAQDAGSSTTASHSSRPSVVRYQDPAAPRLMAPDWSHIETARTRFNVLAGVGVFGAGLSYSTFYTAKPTEALSSLTLMSWAYTVFLSCTFVSIVWQIVLTSGFPMSKGPAYRSRAGIWSAIATSAISAYAGTVLLTLAMTRHTSRAISAAAYTIVGASVVLVVGSTIRYYVTVRKTSRLPGRTAGFAHTMFTQTAYVYRDTVRAPSLQSKQSIPDPPAPTINDRDIARVSAHEVDPNATAALFFLRANDAYGGAGGALQYLDRRCPGWRSLDPARQAEILMETIECFCFDSNAGWLNPEHGHADFQEFIIQAPRWTRAVEDLNVARRSIPVAYVSENNGPLQPVQADQVRRLTKIFWDVEATAREGRDKDVQATTQP